MLRSTVDIRASTDITTVINNLRNIIISNISESKWRELLNEQEFDNYIFEIREDLLSRVFDEIHKKFLEEKSITYTVECAYESWKKIICLNFLYYDPCDEFCREKSSWTEDPEPEICRPDSWSRGNILTEKEREPPKPDKIDTVLSDYQLIKLDRYPSENYFTLCHNSFIETVEQTVEQSMFCEEEGVESQVNFAFTSPASSIKTSTSNIIINRIDSDLPPIHENFFKSVKRVKPTKCESTFDLHGLPSKKVLPCSQKYDEKKFTLPPLRMSVVSNVRRPSPVSPPPLPQVSQTQPRPSDDNNLLRILSFSNTVM